MNVVSTKVLPQFFFQIFSTDTQACFAFITSHNMSNNMLHTPLYPYCVHNLHNMDSKHA
jgi:hypothetical protein